MAEHLTVWFENLVQAALIVTFAPLANGVLKKLKARLQNRRGPGVLQSYRDLRRLFCKQPVVAVNASWLFRASPYVIFAATAVAAAIVPVILVPSPLAFAADIIALAALLALARFFTALAAMDIGTAFGGMGASRDMTFAALTEPVVLMSVFVLSMVVHSTNLGLMVLSVLHAELALQPSLAFALAALLMVAVAETGRIPVDNPATHLELTMVHEAMLLEYSARHLALIEWASQTKLLLFVTLIVNLFFPWGVATGQGSALLMIAFLTWGAKVLLMLVSLAVFETWLAKMRIFRVPEYLAAAFLLAALGMLTHYMLELGAT